MTQAVLAGTINSIDAIDPNNLESGYIVFVEKNDWFITSGNISLEDGKRYIFCGNIACFSPSMHVHDVIADPLQLKPGGNIFRDVGGAARQDDNIIHQIIFKQCNLCLGRP